MTRPLLIPAIVLLFSLACSSSRTIVRAPAPARGPTAAPAPPADGKVWVCHGQRNAKWQQVSERAVRAHRRHGDQVSTGNRRAGGTCSNS